jgi:arylsulfatase A-like enzyme
MDPRQLLRSSALSLALALGACAGDAPEGRVYDLAADLPLAEVRKELGGIDFGTAAARRHLAGGWYGNERAEWEGTTFVWSRGPVSVLEFDVLAPRDLRTEIRCLPLQLPSMPQQSITVELNGRRLTDLALAPGFREYTFTLPGDGLVTGRNRLAFRYRWTASGGPKGRRLAVAWDSLRFRPAPQASAEEPRVEGKGEDRALFVPFGVEVEYFLDLAEKGSFRHRGLAARGRSGGRLVLGVQQEGEEERALELGEEDGAVEVPLPGDGRRLLRLALRAVPVDPGAGGGGLLLEAPAVHGRPSSLPEPAAPAAAAGRPPVVLVVLDGLRPDRLGCYGAKSGLTPNLDALARESLLFEDAQAQSSWTRPAMVSLLTGLGPLAHGVHTSRQFLPDGATTLAERLQEAGYRTAGFSPTVDVGPASGLDQGFETFVPVEEERAAALLDRALLWLGSYGRQGPFFLYVQAAGAPEPYRVALARAVRRGGKGRTDRATALGGLVPLYEAEVAARDRQLGRVVEALRQAGIYEESLVVVLSDHGEALGEHGHLGHSGSLHGEVLGIPLLVKLPGGKTGARVKLPAQQVDVVPTVLARLGLPVPGELRGTDLAALAAAQGEKGGAAAGELARRARFSHLSINHQEVVGVVQDGWKRIEPLGRRFGVEPRLYHVAKDKGESRDLLGRAPVRAGYLNALIRAEVLRSRVRPKRDPEQVDPALLEALGL